MNGRIEREPTPEGRLAAVAKTIMLRAVEEKRECDYADFRDALRPFVERELVLARIDEARKSAGERLTDRVGELAMELIEVNTRIPSEFDI